MADISMNYFSLAMGRHVSIKVILPFEGVMMGRVQEPVKTLYFLPGYSANAESIVSQIKLAAESFFKGLAIVVPDGENAFYVDQPVIGRMYEKFVAEELVNVTRKLFNLSDRREDTYIGGISMGGYGALMLGARHMDRFSKIVAMSPAVDLYSMVEDGLFKKDMMDFYYGSPEKFYAEYYPTKLLTAAKEAGKDLPAIYMCCGEQDPLVHKVCKVFAQEMQEAGIPMDVHNGDGMHEIDYWNAHLSEAIDFIYK